MRALPLHDVLLAYRLRTGKVQLTKVDADQLEAAFAENAQVDDLKPLPTNFGHSRYASGCLFARQTLQTPAQQGRSCRMASDGGQCPRFRFLRYQGALRP